MTSVIIVDDETDITETLSMLLEYEGIHVQGVGKNGKDAVELFSKEKPDFVLTDLAMPEYDGFYAIEKILQIDKFAKIIVISGSITQAMKLRLGDNIKSILEKPVDVKMILKEIKRFSNPIRSF